MATLLQQAIDLAKAGNRDAAETIIRQVLETDPNNEVAWIWLSGVSRDVLVKRTALERVLQLNPDNQLAKEGLKRFGGDVPEEPEPPEPAPPVASVPPEEIPIGNTGEPAIDLPPADLPPILTADTPPPVTAEPVSDVDWSVDAFAEDLAAPPPATTEEKPVFEDLPGDFDFNLDEPPVFDIDLDELTPDESASATAEDDFLLGLEQEPSPIEAPLPTDEPLGAADRLEDLFARADIADDMAAEAEIEEEPDIDPESLTAAETLDEIDFSPKAEEDIHKILEQRRRRQNRMLVAAAIFFAVMILGSCSLYYYVTEIADIYTLMPQLAGAELQKKAPKPKNGVSIVKFHGFPASGATIKWEEDNSAPTCQASTVGLKIDFKNGDPPSLFSNRNCNNGNCTFQKEISPAAITDVEVFYICGKNAVITLYK